MNAQIPNFIIDVAMSITMEELAALKKLSVMQGISVEECARRCMNDQCFYMLNKLSNVPKLELEEAKEEEVVAPDSGAFDTVG